MTDTLKGCAERYPMPSSPTQRGVEGKLVDDEVIADALVVEADDGVEANACDVETPDEGVDKS
jgi:hypothetical protein